MEYRKIRNKRYYIYDHISEFYNDHPDETPLKDWKQGQEGDWVWSDDDRIVQLLKVVDEIKHPGDRKEYKYADGWVRTIVGTFIKTKFSTMDTDFSEHQNRYTFSGNDPKSVKERKGITKKEKIFATNVAVGMGPVKSYLDAFNASGELEARKKAVILLKQDRIMKEVEKSVMDVAKTLGIDHQYVLNKLKCLSDGSSDDNIVLQSTKELAKIIGTSGPIIKQREMGILGMFQGFSPDEIKGVERKQITEKGE